LTLSCVFLFQSPGDHRYLLSFPTRRSSDLLHHLVFLLVGIDQVEPDRAVGDIGFGRDRNAVKRSAARNVDPQHDPNSAIWFDLRSEEHTSELQSLTNLVCRLLL